MTVGYGSEQEDFWAGDFGDEYTERNSTHDSLPARVHLFSTVFAHYDAPASCLELGANVGMNLRALKILYPQQEQFGIEINSGAALELEREIGHGNVYNGSFLNWLPDKKYECAMTVGVLIHIAPDDLERAYSQLGASSSKYVLMAEYFNPTPVEIEYRGHRGKLYKRDFCHEFLEVNAGFKLLDYGFVYSGGRFPLDDLTWFLCKRTP